MKKIDPKLKKFVQETAKQAAWNIGYSHYHMDVEYMSDEKVADDMQGMAVAAECVVNRRYLRCTIRIYPLIMQHWEDGNKASVRECITHEIAHLATEHMKDLIFSAFKDEGETKDAWESLTTIVGNMAMRIDDLQKQK